MTYEIYYLPEDSAKNSRGYTMFDIEYYRKQSVREDDEYFSEISCLTCVEGLARFLKDKLQKNDNFEIESFIKDATEVQEVRGLLYERFDNTPKDFEKSLNFHYHIFGEVLENLLNDFADKYGLFINKD